MVTLWHNGEVVNKIYSMKEYFAKKYAFQVQKITVSLDFTCPNIDGRVGSGGCIYCLDGSVPHKKEKRVPLKEQIKKGIESGDKRFGAGTRYMVYFQTNSNTYAAVATLKEMYASVFEFDRVIGIAIGTRPDCVGEEVLDILKTYATAGKEVWLELGLQSANEATLIKINRGHTVATFVDAVKRAKHKGLKVAAHVIVGFPWETIKDFLASATLLVELGVEGIKIHPLYILEGTPLGEMYKKEAFELLTLNAYVGALAQMVKILPENTIIMRVSAEGYDSCLLAPEYCSTKYKSKIKAMLERELQIR